MPDIQLRFGKDMLVLSAPVDAALTGQGVDVDADREFLNLAEPESIRDTLRLQQVVGAQCLVTATNGITRARLAHLNLEDRAADLASASLTIVNSLKPQHIIAEIGPTNLPIDPSSKQSLKANRDQYAQAVRDFGTEGIDAFFLNGLVSVEDVRCALMGVRMVCDLPVFVSVDVDEAGNLSGRSQSIEDVFAVMAEFEASVLGFCSSAPQDDLLALAKRAVAAARVSAGPNNPAGLPVLVQVSVSAVNSKQWEATAENPYYCADTMVGLADSLRACGVQFVRACGAATPAYTGALVAATAGFDVVEAR